MDMEVTAWNSLYTTMTAQEERRPISRATLRRIGAFARAAPTAARLVPAAQRGHRGARGGDAGAGRPGGRRHRLGGRAVRRRRPGGADRGDRGRRGRAWAADQVVLGEHRRGADPRPAHGRVRPRAADADRVLHPHPDRRAGEPAEQRRDRRAAGVQRHAVRGGRQPGHPGADAGRDARHLLADHPAGAAAAAGLRAAGPADGHQARPAGAGGGQSQRVDEHPDDGAVLRARRDAGQAVRAAGAGVRRVRGPGAAGCGTSASAPRWCSGSSSPR